MSPAFRVSLREHKFYNKYNVEYIYSKPSAGVIRADSPIFPPPRTTNWRLGDGHFFFVVSRAWIHDKYIRLRWRSTVSSAGWPSAVEVWDGGYNRASDSDFPLGAARATKGNGLIQTGITQLGTFPWTLNQFQVDTSGGSQDNVTIFITTHDAWAEQYGWLEIDYIEINREVGGTIIYDYNFADSITMERSGTQGDYGYIGTNDAPTGPGDLPLGPGPTWAILGDGDLLAGFILRQAGSQDLAAGFDGQVSENLSAEFISRLAGSQDLSAEFIVRRSASVDLLAGFDGQVSLNLPGGFISRQPGSQELFGEFIVQHADSQDLAASFDGQVSLNLPAAFISKQGSESLPAEFEIRRSASQELPAEFIVQQAGSEELPAEFISRQAGSQELLAGFIVRRASRQELLGELEVRHPASQELPAELIVRQAGTQDLVAGFTSSLSGSQELLGVFISRQLGSQDLAAAFNVAASSEDLPAEFIVRRSASQNLPAEFISRLAGSQDLSAEFISRQAGTQDLAAGFDGQVSLNLPAEFVLRQVGSQDLAAGFYAYQFSENLPAEFISRHSTSEAFLGLFTVRHPWPLWTNRRWLNGVVELSEARISDAFLEEIIGGVMDDVKTWLLANEVGQYRSWTNIDLTPMAIRRATTYGVVASLYARDVFSARGRFAVKVAPVDVKILATNEGAMEYWESLMIRVLELFLSAQGLDRIWVDTRYEDPVFSMADIPLYTWSPGE